MSIVGRMTKLFDTNGKSELSCISGIKFFSMVWIVFGHVFVGYLLSPFSNLLDIFEYEKTTRAMFQHATTFAVDTFLCLAGLLVVYNFLQSTHSGKKFNIPLFYIHRYLRLTPALGALILVSVYLLDYMGSGPRWVLTHELFQKQCRKYWWSSLLYLQNYANIPPNVCLDHTWYLSVDTQLYFLSPIFLILLWKYPKAGIALLVSATLGSMVFVGYVTYKYRLPALFNSPLIWPALVNYLEKYYFKTHTRMSSYLIGALGGYILYFMKSKKYKIKKMPLLVLWIGMLAVMLGCIFAGHDTLMGPEYRQWDHVLYMTFVRPSWSVVIAWVVVACVLGHGGVINSFLSNKIFQVLSRFSYSVYLIHYVEICLWEFSRKAGVYFTEADLMFDFWGHFMFSFGISYIWILAFESPIIVWRNMELFYLFLVLLSVQYVTCGYKELLQRSVEDVVKKENKSECDRALNKLLNNILHPTLDDLWGYKMIDASSSFLPDGFLLGNMGDMGNFEECLDIASKDQTIKGQYCLKVVLPIPGLNRAVKELARGLTGYPIALCLPNRCSEKEINAKFKIFPHFQFHCQTKETRHLPLTKGAIATICFLCVITTMMFLSTTYDIYCRQNNKGTTINSISKSDLSCISGIKFLSLIWTIFGHIVIGYVMSPLSNILDVIECLHHTWYLSVDTQLYFLSPIFLILLWKYPKAGIALLITATSGSMATVAYLTYHYRLPAFDLGDFLEKYYFLTHTRMSSYLIGALGGYILYVMKNKKYKISKILLLFLWPVMLAIMLGCIFAGNDTLRGPEYKKWDHVLYMTFVRPSWSVFIVWMVVACALGQGGIINSFLSNKIFQVLSRFSYSIYLIHFVEVFVWAFSRKSGVYFSEVGTLFDFWGHFMFSFGISYVWILSFESPVIVLEKILLGRFVQ
nr:unnamed protein product [Callosobruchus analis]